jgi:hypothetical protein
VGNGVSGNGVSGNGVSGKRRVRPEQVGIVPCRMCGIPCGRVGEGRDHPHPRCAAAPRQHRVHRRVALCLNGRQTAAPTRTRWADPMGLAATSHGLHVALPCCMPMTVLPGVAEADAAYTDPAHGDFVSLLLGCAPKALEQARKLLRPPCMLRPSLPSSQGQVRRRRGSALLRFLIVQYPCVLTAPRTLLAAVSTARERSCSRRRFASA